MTIYTVTVEIQVSAESENQALGVIDQAFDEWCNGDHDDDDPIIEQWTRPQNSSIRASRTNEGQS
jgi:hypothetical protein